MNSWPPPDPATVLPGDCRATLATLPPGVFQTCVTSIPYWGLRAYGTDPLVWGGDPACSHDWQEQGRRTGQPQRDHGGDNGWSNTRGTETHRAGSQLTQSLGDTCPRCTAWRGEYGREPTVDAYIAHTVEVFRAVRRVLRPDGTLWLNIGDAYTGGGGYYPDAPSNQPEAKKARGVGQGQGSIKTRPFSRQGLGPKQLLLLPARVALALQADGWICRAEIIWAKQNPLPESVTDRPTKAHEQIYLFALQPHYYYDQEAVREALKPGADHTRATVRTDDSTSSKNRILSDQPPPGRFSPHMMQSNPAGRNLRDVWPLASQPYPAAHFATFPDAIPRRAIRAGTSARGQCPACGAPWHRTVATTYEPHGPGAKASRKTTFGERTSGDTERGALRPQEMPHGRATRIDTTTGWAPTCTCDAGEPIPQFVLDPFAGSGTTLAEARKLGRNAVGCELQPAYLPLSARRIAQAPVPLPALVEHL